MIYVQCLLGHSELYESIRTLVCNANLGGVYQTTCVHGLSHTIFKYPTCVYASHVSTVGLILFFSSSEILLKYHLCNHSLSSAWSTPSRLLIRRKSLLGQKKNSTNFMSNRSGCLWDIISFEICTLFVWLALLHWVQWLSFFTAFKISCKLREMEQWCTWHQLTCPRGSAA